MRDIIASTADLIPLLEAADHPRPIMVEYAARTPPQDMIKYVVDVLETALFTHPKVSALVLLSPPPYIYGMARLISTLSRSKGATIYIAESKDGAFALIEQGL